MRYKTLTYVAALAVIAISNLNSINGMAAADPDVRWQSAAAMHAYFNERFIDSPGNGLSRMLKAPMRITDSMWLTFDATTYKMGSLELVGIANHTKPVVFVQLQHRRDWDGETRALSSFEGRAIEKLRAGEDVVVHQDSKGLTVVGALKAKADCLVCHNSDSPSFKVGDLLGALTYRLDKANQS